MDNKDSYKLFVKVCKMFNIPIDGSKISWEGAKGKDWQEGWGDRPGNYIRYDNSGYNEEVTYKRYFEEYLEDQGISLEELSAREFEDYFLTWAETDIEIGSGADKVLFGDLVSEYGSRDFWRETKKSPWEQDAMLERKSSAKNKFKKMREEEENFDFETWPYYMEESFQKFKDTWIAENPTSWRDATDRCNDIWSEENELRQAADYPSVEEEDHTAMSWDNEETGAYVYGDAYVDHCFIYYIFKHNLDISNMSLNDIAEAFFTWADNSCYLKLEGDTWSDKEHREIKWIPWYDYIDGWKPEWASEEDGY